MRLIKRRKYYVLFDKKGFLIMQSKCRKTCIEYGVNLA